MMILKMKNMEEMGRYQGGGGGGDTLRTTRSSRSIVVTMSGFYVFCWILLAVLQTVDAQGRKMCTN